VTQSRSFSSDVAFTRAVKEIQTRKGSRANYARVEESGGWQTEVTDNLADFIAAQTSFFLATANAEGQPYIQHRGGPPGFLKVLDKSTLAFADFRGNQQFITQGNLNENPKAHIFLIDYVNRQRVKIWGDARVVEDDAALIASLMPQAYRARPEQAILFTISAWDSNCPQHIPQKIDFNDVIAVVSDRERQITELRAQVEELTRRLSEKDGSASQ
jgi:predicted pyridoxine 5'-phosphate oxidase superfamily flavin-nucleotide-binding protein